MTDDINKSIKEAGGLLQELYQELLEEEREQEITLHDALVEKRKKQLKALGKNEEQIQTQLIKDRQRLLEDNSKSQFDKELERQKDIIENAATLQEKKDAERKVRQMENARAVADKAAETFSNIINGAYDRLTDAAKFYGEKISDIETRLLGSGKTYTSVADMISRTFAVSPFFSMRDVMNKTSAFVEKGIAYNVEMRAAMAVISDKVAATFNAFDSSLLRLIKIQQQDSTRARLGMESILTEFLNSQYKNTEYLNEISKNVSANILEASATMDRDNAFEYEFEIQKWLGSMSSVGVSDKLIDTLSKGLGYLGSGDISSLVSNQTLQQLLVASVSRGSGRDYGDMIVEGAGAEDVKAILTGLRSLVSDIYSTDNLVAMNQYAQAFGLSMSDLRSILNLTTEDIKTISSNLLSYDSALKRVDDETNFSKLWSRSSGAEIVDNLFSNLIDTAGKNIGKNPAAYIGWQIAGFVNDFLAGVETGIDIQPFGVGTHMNLSVGDITKATTTMAALASGIVDVGKGLSSITGINLKALEDIQQITRGEFSTIGGLRKETPGQSQVSAVVDVSESTIYDQSLANADKTATQLTDVNMDEEKEKMKKTQEDISKLADSVDFIVQLLNVSGIVIRGMNEGLGSVSHFDDLNSSDSTGRRFENI